MRRASLASGSLRDFVSEPSRLWGKAPAPLAWARGEQSRRMEPESVRTRLPRHLRSGRRRQNKTGVENLLTVIVSYLTRMRTFLADDARASCPPDSVVGRVSPSAPAAAHDSDSFSRLYHRGADFSRLWMTRDPVGQPVARSILSRLKSALRPPVWRDSATVVPTRCARFRSKRRARRDAPYPLASGRLEQHALTSAATI